MKLRDFDSAIRYRVAMLVGIGVVAVSLLSPLPATSQEGRWLATANAGCLVWHNSRNPVETVTWSGPCVSGKAQGEGTLSWQWREGDRPRSGWYTGSMVEGRMEGRGKGVTFDGKKYEGEMANNSPHGRGVLAYTSARGVRMRYEGEFHRGAAQGRGVYTETGSDGLLVWYEGDFLQNQLHGSGKIVWADGSRYVGEFRSGQADGRGEFFWTNGDRYTGDFAVGNREGLGILRFSDGNQCDGRWKSGELVDTGSGVSDGVTMKCKQAGMAIEFFE